ncbi:uncharacterized protein LOC132038659 [Lycium ferocissimum]|uniref:uncharacterized protein LOC132038659 n=1 Tax=Lycium ferocissimum TaxID=112874 RepID=UPI0028167DE4|nr:uncharacterized protein LOC132038659 [Lycium ferocissimum]
MSTTTVEDLFVEIFDRKHKIIELVKQHTDRYSQHLATKCKIQEINPPSWLCNSQQELNKEQLISEYFPRPPTARHASARCSLNKRPVVRDDNEDRSHGTFLEVHVPYKGPHPEDGTANTAVDPDNNQECALNTVPKPDVSVNSPLDQTDARVLNNFNDLDLSLARIQRSKSRQKALQLRNSAQAEVTGCSSQQKKCDVAPIGIGLSTFEQVDHNYESQKWSEPCVVSNSSGGFRESAERNHEEEKVISLHTGESSKHKASTQCLECVNYYLKGDNLSDVAERSHTTKVDNSFATAQKSHSTHKHSCNFASKSTSLSASQLTDGSDKADHLGESIPVVTEVSKLKEFVEVHQHEGIEVNRVTRSRSNCKQVNCINDSLKVDGSAGVVQKDDHTQARSAGCVSDRPLQVANTSSIHKRTVKSYQETKKKNGNFCGRITRSRSMAQKLPCLDDDSHASISTFSDRVNTGLFAPAIGGSSEVLFNNLDSSKSVRPSLGLDHKSPMTQSNMDNEVIIEPVDTSTVVGSGGGGSMFADSEKSLHEDYNTHCPTGSKSISPSSDNNDAHDQQGNTEAVIEGSPTCRSRTSNSKPKVGVEHVVANPPHDCFMPMKPKQLDFDDREECNLKRTFTPNFEEKSLKSTGEISNISLVPTSEKKISGSPVDNRLSREQSTLEQAISSKLDEVPGSSFTTKIREPAGTEMNGWASDMNEHHASRNTKYGSKGRQCSRQSSHLHDDETLSNDVGRHDVDANLVELSVKESYNSSVELQIEVGGNSCDRTAQCLPASYVANTKIAATPHFSSLSKKVTGDSQDCLAKNFEIEYPLSISPDAKRRSCTPNDPNLSSFNGKNGHADVCVKCDMDRDSHHKESGMLTWSPVQSRQNDDKNLNLSVSSEIQNTTEPAFDVRFRSVKLDSWPQVKRKNIEDNQTNCFSACPNSQMSKLCQIKMDALKLNFSTSQEKTDNVVEHTPSRTKSSSGGISEKKNCYLKKGTASLPKLLNEVVGKSCDRNPQCLPASYVVNTKTAATRHISTLTERVTSDFQDCLAKELEDPTSISPDAKRQPSMPNDPNLSCLDGENSHGDACCKHNMDRHSHQKEDDMLTWSLQQSGYNDEENLDLSISSETENPRESSLFDGRFRSVKLDSWPQVKRKRVEDKQTNCFSLCPSSQMSKLYHIQRDAISFDSNTIQEKSGNVVEHTPIRAKSSNMGISEKKICLLEEGIGSLLKLQNKVDAIYFEKQYNSTESASSSDEELLRVSHVSSLSKEPADKELETGEEHEPLSNAEKFSDEQGIPDLLHLEKNVELDHPENLTCLERKSHIGEQSLYSQSFVCSSPQNRDLDIIDADQSEPVLEGFIIDASTADGELDIAQLEINYETTIQRASILEQICKSASAHTPLSHYTPSFGFDRTQNLYQSLPNGLLEHLDLSTFLSEDDKQLRASYSCVDEVKDSKLEMPRSDYQPSYGCQFGGRSGNQYQSPVGKFWERIPSHSSSSEKGLNLNPELMCFPIEEDPNSSEENETADVAGKIRDEFDSTVVSSHANGLPLADITNSCLNPPASVSAAERSHARGSLDSANTDVSGTGYRNKAKRKLGSSFRNMSAAKVKQTFSMGAKGIKQGKESLRRSSRPKLSAKSSFKRERQKLSEKGPSHNNIVSNMTSFIPLVQQKQAAAVCTGKRDVKVKALEAAEAAKRLEEKRENERKMRKEAMKHERARLEQENSKQLEFHKKKKEEEKKKKEADAIARKRLREEEEKNERERKRKRVEEARRQQREQDDKTHAKRAEKDKGLPTNDEKTMAKKKCNSDVEKCQKEKERVGKTFKKQESEAKPTETLRNDSFQATPSPGRCRISDTSTDHEKATCVLGKPNANTECGAKRSREKSYEISPYQCSDDEEDEDEDPPIRKFIPSWASKPNVASVLPLQQGIDPDSIFPPESFCSMDEVLVPRKVQ